MGRNRRRGGFPGWRLGQLIWKWVIRGGRVPADDSDATRPTWSRAPRRASVEGRKNQVFGGFAGCGGRWVAQTAPKHVLEPPQSRCTAVGGGRRSHAAPAAAARFCRFSRYGRSSRVPSHKIRCRGFPLTKQKCGISLSRPPRPCDQRGSHSLLAKRTSLGAKNGQITQLRGLNHSTATDPSSWRQILTASS